MRGNSCVAQASSRDPSASASRIVRTTASVPYPSLIVLEFFQSSAFINRAEVNAFGYISFSVYLENNPVRIIKNRKTLKAPNVLF